MAKIQLWRPAGQFIGTRHGLNTGPDEHAVTEERTLIFEGPIWSNDVDGEMVGPLEWKVLPSRFGPPHWVMPLRDLQAAVLPLAALWGDELVEVP